MKWKGRRLSNNVEDLRGRLNPEELAALKAKKALLAKAALKAKLVAAKASAVKAATGVASKAGVLLANPVTLAVGAGAVGAGYLAKKAYDKRKAKQKEQLAIDRAHMAWKIRMKNKSKSTEYTSVEDAGAKSFLHKRNPLMGAINPLSAVAFHYTKAGKERRELAKASKSKTLKPEQIKRLRKLNHMRTSRAIGGAIGGAANVPTLGLSGLAGGYVGQRLHKNKSEDSYNEEDTFDGGGGAAGGGGTGAGSPGMSSVGNMGGSTNRGLRPLKKNEESSAKAFALKKMLNNK